MSRADKAIAELARGQHSVFSGRQAVARGITRPMLRSRVAAGRLDRIDHDVFHVAGTEVTWHAKVHHRVLDDQGRLIAEVDLAYPHLKIAIELDGGVHRERDVFERDRPRQNGIVLNGWIVLRFTWKTLVERPDEIVRAVCAAIELRSAPQPAT